jgi:hypothetical protein
MRRKEELMCIRCIGGTFFVSMLIGASLAFIGFKTRMYMSHHETETAASHRLLTLGYPSSHRPPKIKEAEVSFYFERAPLGDVARFVSNVTHRQILADLDVDLMQSVSFVSLQPLSSLEVYQRFLKLLAQRELTITYQGELSKITATRTKTLAPLPKLPSLPALQLNTLAILEIPNVDAATITQARKLLLHPERLRGAVLEIKALDCASQELHFLSVAVGSLWSKLGLRAGDSLRVSGEAPLFSTPRGAELFVYRNEAPMRLQYKYAN